MLAHAHAMPAVDPGAVRPAVVAECRRSDKALPCSGTGPVVLLFRGGSFLIPAPPVSMAAEMEAARSLGFTPRYVNYTAANVLAAWRDTRAAASREAARGRDVYAYGFSAGGVLASLLAQKDRVLAAAAVAPPSNLTTWERNGPIWDYIGNPGPRTKRFLSPPFHPTANPITLYHSTEDPLSPFRANLLWARRDPKVRLVPVAGTHTTGDRHHAIARTALSWLGRFHRRVLAARAGRKAIGW